MLETGGASGLVLKRVNYAVMSSYNIVRYHRNAIFCHLTSSDIMPEPFSLKLFRLSHLMISHSFRYWKSLNLHTYCFIAYEVFSSSYASNFFSLPWLRMTSFFDVTHFCALSFEAVAFAIQRGKEDRYGGEGWGWIGLERHTHTDNVFTKSAENGDSKHSNMFNLRTWYMLRCCERCSGISFNGSKRVINMIFLLSRISSCAGGWTDFLSCLPNIRWGSKKLCPHLN